MALRLPQRLFWLAITTILCALSNTDVQAHCQSLRPVNELPPEFIGSSLLHPKSASEVHLRLIFAGDLMQHIPQVRAAQCGDGHNYGPVFEYVRPLFEAAHLAVVNLETTLTTSTHYTGYPRFRSPVALADAMRDMGVDVALLANNHCLDGDLRGLQTTLSELSRCRIAHTGVFADSLDLVSNHPLRFSLKGIRFALLNYTYGTNEIPIPKGVSVNIIDTTRIASDLLLARADNPDCVIVCIHWGEEYQTAANHEQRRLASFLRRNGANLIIGSHPHVGQPWQSDSTHVLVYSLGNFVSNQRKHRTDGGLLAQIDVTRRQDGRLVYNLDIIPTWVDLPTYRILPIKVADTMSLSPPYHRYRRWIDTLQMRSYK